MNKKYTLIIFIALISFLMLACSMIYDTTINEDGSGTFSIEIKFSDEEVELVAPMLSDFGSEIESPQDICDFITTELSIGFRADTDFIVDDSNYSCVITFEYNDLEELEHLYSEIEVVAYDLEFNDDGFLVYDIEFNLDQEIDAGLEDYGIDLTLEYLWQVTSPYKIVEHNADSISGKTVSVEIDPAGKTKLYFLAGSSEITKLYSGSTLEFLTEIAEDE